MQEEIDSIIDRALFEDFPEGDITSESIIPVASESRAVILAKEGGILAGMDIAARVFEKIDPHLVFEQVKKDGQEIRRGDALAKIQGSSLSLLKGERTALNFLQRLSGIATKTRQFVKALEGSKTKVLDTRKTTPGLRILEKYAVKMGGGKNHRMNLSDMVLIKDNHLMLAPSIAEAVQKARAKVGPDIKIEVEATNLDQVKEALDSGADRILLDNMSLEEMKEIVTWVAGRVPLEASGNIDLSRARSLADLGLDYISVGGLTHSFQSLDISLEITDQFIR